MSCKSVLIATVFLAACSVTLAKYTDCGSKTGSLTSVEVSKCPPDAARCVLKRNHNATMIITFTTNSPTDRIKAVVHGLIMGVAIPFDLPNPDGCKDSGITCPIVTGTTYNYTTTMPILASYPRVLVDIKWELTDSEGNDIICAVIPARLV